MQTEKQKMLTSQYYQAWDKELTTEREKAKTLCHQLNTLGPADRKKRKLLLSELIVASDDAWVESPFNCDYGYNIRVGNGFYANHGCTILDGAPVTMGDNCLLAPGVVISTATHPLEPAHRASGEEIAHPITLGNNVWLGANVTICPGVTLGDNVVVGAGSVVTSDLPANGVYAGVPARKIKTIESSGDGSS